MPHQAASDPLEIGAVMSLKQQMISYCPRPIIQLARGIRYIRRLGESKLLLPRLLKSKRPLKVELGSGAKKGANGWTTLDVVVGCDFYCNLAKGLPFPDNCVTEIYSSHLFEHLTFREAQKLLGECVRVLTPGGRFSICVPNAKLYLQAYIDNDIFDEKKFFGYDPAYNHTTKIDYVNYVAYMDGGHKYMFDEENLLYILRKAGLNCVRLRSFDEELDLKVRDFESIYAEGFK